MRANDRSFPVPEQTWYGPYGTRPGIERPDAEIKSDILRAMERDRRVDDLDITITVENGVVTLTGSVTDGDVRTSIADDARDTPGVVDVHDELAVSEA